MKITRKTKVLILSHGYRKAEKGGGPPQDIRDFLLPKVKSIDYVVHPFTFADFRKSFIVSYINGVNKNEAKSHSVNGPEWFQYVQHFLITLLFLLRNRKKYDICFALDSLCLLPVLILKKMGRIKRLVYYSIDYTPQRFTNSLLNTVYHSMDNMACRYSDLNWVVAKHMIQARKKNGIPINKCPPFVEVPIGFHGSKIKLRKTKAINRHHLIFVGSLFKKQGLQLVINALPKIVKKFPSVHLTIIGTGNYENTLKKLVKQRKLTKSVEFKGFIKDHRQVESLLTKAGIGLAPYKPEPSSITYYADLGKIKLYLGCGLPVVTTSVPVISSVLEKSKAGVIANYSPQSLSEALISLLKDKKKYALSRSSAIKLSKNYDVEKILRKAIKNIP